eukprot:487837_1
MNILHRFTKPYKRLFTPEEVNNKYESILLLYAPIVALIIGILLNIRHILWNTNDRNDMIYLKTYSNLSEFYTNINESIRAYKKYKIPIINDSGYCLDGSDPIFYYRPSITIENSTKYYIHFAVEQGTVCVNMFHCYKNSKTLKTMKRNKYGYISNINATKMGYDSWNEIYIQSCDGFLFLGNNYNEINQSFTKKLKRKRGVRRGNTTYKEIINVTMYFQGNIILHNFFEYLFNDNKGVFNMKNATDIIISGFDVSCVAVLSQFEKIKQFMDGLDKNVNFNMVLWKWKDVYWNGKNVNISWIINNMNLSDSLNKKCVEMYLTSDSDQCVVDENVVQCLRFESLYQYIDTNVFIN